MIKLIKAIVQIIAKKIPGRRESAIKELQRLERLLAKALKENEDTLAAQVRKRMKELRNTYEEIGQ